MYGAVPPVAVTVAEASVAPLHLRSTFVVVNTNSVGSETVTETVLAQALASVMVKVYVPAVKLPMVEFAEPFDQA